MVDVDVVTVPTVQFISLFIETLLLGFFIVLYAITIWILLYRPGTLTNRFLFIASTTMLILAGAHLGIGVYRGYQGFIRNAGIVGAANTFFSDTRKATSGLKFALYVTQTFTGDAFMVYRVYIIWNYDKRIAILPVLLSLGAAVTGYIACYDMFTHDHIKPLTTATRTYGSLALTVFLALACLSNLVATALVILRIVRSNRRMRNYRTVVLADRRNVLEAFIQSAAIYSTVLVTLFITYAVGINPNVYGVDILMPLIGVVFTLIIIRLGLGQATRERQSREISQVNVGRANSVVVHRRVSRSLEDTLRVRVPPPIRRSPLKREEGVRLIGGSQDSSIEDVAAHRYLPSLDLGDVLLNNHSDAENPGQGRDRRSSEDFVVIPQVF